MSYVRVCVCVSVRVCVVIATDMRLTYGSLTTWPTNLAAGHRLFCI